MDTLAMHRTLTSAGFRDDQAEAIIKVMIGGVATKQDLDHLELRLNSRMDKVEVTLGTRIDKLENKVNPVRIGVVLAVIAPALVRYAVG